jgi:hypothetical protein
MCDINSTCMDRNYSRHASCAIPVIHVVKTFDRLSPSTFEKWKVQSQSMPCQSVYQEWQINSLFLFSVSNTPIIFIHCNWLYPATQFFNNTVPHQPKFIEVIQILERNSQFESQAVSDLNDLFSEYYMFSDGAQCAPVNLICLFLTQYRERDGMTFQPFSLLHFQHPSASPDICMF